MRQAMNPSTFTAPVAPSGPAFIPPPVQPLAEVDRAAKDAHRGVLILVLGLVSLSACAATGPFAWYLANQDIPKMKYGNMDPAGLTMAQAGKICGIIGTGFLALTVVYLGVWLYFFLPFLTRLP